mmetsp:Transcript_33911/g.59112  ORF Transcript_33911/g.59112 Transcript_33911/m.59112 type:complete len:414 (+) Transcript_33911:1176-2417(+)
MVFRFGIIFDIDEQDSKYQLVFMISGYMGNIIGSLSSAPIANKWGRKNAVLAGFLLFALGASIDVPNYPASTVVARLVEGTSNGLATTVIPYIFNETLPLKSRGTFGVTMQFMWVLGMVTTLTLSIMTFQHTSPGLAWWQFAFIGLIIVALVMALVIRKCYKKFDTILWLLSKNRKADAREVMRRIHSNPGLVPQEVTFWRDELSEAPDTRKPLLLGIILAVSNISTGYYYYIYYGGGLISDTKLSLEQRIYTILIHISFTLLGSIGSFFFINRMTRKNLMLTGLFSMGVVQIVLAFVVMFSASKEGSIALISLNLFIYESTAAPLYWVYAPELMKLDDFARNQVVYWVLAALNSLLCSYTTTSYLSFLIILLFGIFCIALACVVWCFVIETRNMAWPDKYSMMSVVNDTNSD